jgi:hypothetical protein
MTRYADAPKLIGSCLAASPPEHLYASNILCSTQYTKLQRCSEKSDSRAAPHYLDSKAIGIGADGVLLCVLAGRSGYTTGRWRR